MDNKTSRYEKTYKNIVGKAKGVAKKKTGGRFLSFLGEGEAKGMPEGRKKRGRPRTTWRRTVERPSRDGTRKSKLVLDRGAKDGKE